MADFSLDLTKYVTKPSERAHPELLLFYGRPGCGKTWLAASASELPNVKRVAILDTEGSTVGTLTDFDDDVVDIISTEKDTPEESFIFLNTILDKFFDSTETHPYDVVIVDTFDVAQDQAKKYFFGKAPLTKSGEKDGFWVWAQIQEWSEKVARGLKRMKALGILVVHEKKDTDEDGKVTVQLKLAGAAKDIVPGIPDTLAYLRRVVEDGQEVTLAYFATDDNKVTKNRFHFPPVVKEPTIPGLWRYIDRDKTEVPDAAAG